MASVTLAALEEFVRGRAPSAPGSRARELAAAGAPPEAPGAAVVPRAPLFEDARGCVLATRREDVHVRLTADVDAGRLAAFLASRSDQPSGMARVFAARRLGGARAFAVWREAVALGGTEGAAVRGAFGAYNVAAAAAARGGAPGAALGVARGAARALEEHELLGGVARALGWLLDLGALPLEIDGSVVGHPVVEPARGVVLADFRVALPGRAAAAEPPPLQ